MPDFGSDFSAITDIDAPLTVVDGTLGLGQALLRRITTPRGALWYAPDYGIDVRAYINTTTDPRVIEQAIESELLNEERIDDVTATLTVVSGSQLTDGQSWSIALAVETDEGPFAFTLTIDLVTSTILLTGIT